MWRLTLKKDGVTDGIVTLTAFGIGRDDIGFVLNHPMWVFRFRAAAFELPDSTYRAWTPNRLGPICDAWYHSKKEDRPLPEGSDMLIQISHGGKHGLRFFSNAKVFEFVEPIKAVRFPIDCPTGLSAFSDAA
jgi:hypothetical protein